MAGPVPTTSSLADIYTEDALPVQTKRWSSLLSQFEAEYGHPAAVVARSPGRVNIIGEHIDYSLYSVLPMAITADAILAFSVTDTPADSDTFTLRVANAQSDKYPARTFEVPIAGDVPIDAKVHEWSNYFKSGLRGALGLLRRKHGAAFRPKGMEILMDGNVPVGGGLSSSAAFVSASALAVMLANGEQTVDKTELTELAIVSERAVGVNSGGMDQSASVFSQRGSALFVSFVPSLTARPVFFPTTNPELSFVIAQSFVTSNKQVTGPIHYNLRVVECSMAGAYLNAALNPRGTELPKDASPLGVSLHGFHDAYFAHNKQPQHDGASREEAAEAQLRELIAVTKDTLTNPEGYTREEIAGVLGVSPAELEQIFMSKLSVRADRFKLRQRALHVFEEALRVLQFMKVLEQEAPAPASASGAAAADTTAYNQRLGAVLNATQDSCRDLYECSAPEIDELCRIARDNGSYGSRLTGAGWGGCTVHMVPADKVAAVTEAWEREYYSKRELTAEQREGAVVVSRPGSGSAAYLLKDGGL
ncbi:Galactokinase [Colletotrichum higginsianum]|uniref:Galactokinase n=1 Tax=Colletotrichum higginsianum TaxID=80884 RepID=A0A4T0VMZ3_9PEZI|nr:Galactokinase [Colletotrichum higginsianum]